MNGQGVPEPAPSEKPPAVREHASASLGIPTASLYTKKLFSIEPFPRLDTLTTDAPWLSVCGIAFQYFFEFF